MSSGGWATAPSPATVPSRVHSTPPLQFTKCVHRHYHIGPKRPLKTTINLSLWLPSRAHRLPRGRGASGHRACQGGRQPGQRGFHVGGWQVVGGGPSWGAEERARRKPEGQPCKERRKKNRLAWESSQQGWRGEVWEPD